MLISSGNAENQFFTGRHTARVFCRQGINFLHCGWGEFRV